MEHENIHPSAKIHSSVIIEGHVEIGENTTIGPYSYLKGPLVIGTETQIGANVQIGVDPEHKEKVPCGTVYIGNKNVIREFSVIQRGTGDLDTRVKNNCYIMAYCYIAHDSLIESNAILCARVSIGGHCHIQKGVFLGIGASLHQFSTIGAHALVGMGSVVVKDVPPFCIVKGNPAHFSRLHEFPLKELTLVIEDFSFEDGQLCSDHPYVEECITNFKKYSKRTPIVLQ